ncbi:hypothetical protein [Sphingomonas sp. UYP23]
MTLTFEDIAQIVGAEESEQPLRFIGPNLERVRHLIDNPTHVSRNWIRGGSFSRLVGR